MRDADVVFDWNVEGPTAAGIPSVQLHDETLRDGLQSPSVRDPDLASKKRVVDILDSLGVYSVDVGLPGAGERAFEECLELVTHIRDRGLSIVPTIAARTHPNDIEPAIEIHERTGVPLEAMMFLGSSPIRMYTEGWTEDRLEDLTRSAMKLAVGGGIAAAFVTEDTTRSKPSTLQRLFEAAIDDGATALVVCDTCGHADPAGVRHLIGWTRELTARVGTPVRVDWHGHNDRGMALINALAAVEAGADRIHGTVLGVGERVGNTALDQLLINLKLYGVHSHDLSRLNELCELVSESCAVPIPVNYPVFGADAFRTATGVHAAAVIKAKKKGDDWIADRVYSSVPAGWVGREQEICIGFMSGASNVRFWLEQRGIEPDEAVVQAILSRAKSTKEILSTEDVLAAAALAR